MTSRRLTLGLGAIYVAVSTLSPLLLKTTPSDLDLYFWPSAETIVSGHPLLIYSAHLRDSYPNANGPLGLLPLIPMAALANAFGWAGSLHGRAALTGAVVSVVVLLLTSQVVHVVAAARGGVRWPLAVASLVLLAPALWIALIDYGHVEQPLELCLILPAVSASLHNRHALAGVALGAAILTRTIAGLCLIPFLILPMATRRMRPMTTSVLAAAITVCIGLAPFLLANGHAVTHSLLTYRGSLAIGGGSFWVVVRHASWAVLVRNGDVYLAAAVACALVAYTLRRDPAVATTHAGLMGLLTIASCCFPLLAKTVFPYYLLEPYVFSVVWWLARTGSVRNRRAIVPLLLTVDVLVVKAASASPFSIAGAVASVAASALVLVAIILVILDLLHAPEAHGVGGERTETPPRTVSAECPKGLSCATPPATPVRTRYQGRSKHVQARTCAP